VRQPLGESVYLARTGRGPGQHPPRRVSLPVVG
jgi:hypothetical protein